MVKIKPYGDTLNDGKIQLSFTLPIKQSDKGDLAAKKIALDMGLKKVEVVHSEAIDNEFSFILFMDQLQKM